MTALTNIQKLVYIHMHYTKTLPYLYTITAQAANPIEESKHSARSKALLISQ